MAETSEEPGKANLQTSKYLILLKNIFVYCLYVFLILGLPSLCLAQELEPRRWSHLPTGANFAGGGYAYTEADIFVDPVIRAENVEMEMHTWAVQYIRTFELFQKSARIDFTQAYQEGRWTGLIDGVPRSIKRNGLSDSVLRFAMNLYGAPPLEGKEFAAYRAKADVETIFGTALVVQLPTGDYMEDKLINLGSNRFTFRPQLGVVHNRGKWSMELTGEVLLYTDNDDFFNGKELEQDPPIVALTSFAMVGDREKALDAGCTGYIEKPINPETFLMEIGRYLTKCVSRRTRE